MTSTVKKPIVNKDVAPVSAGRKLLNELLENSKSLPVTESDLGSIQLGINEIRKRASKLRKSTSNVEDTVSFDNLTKAHYLLAGKVSFDEIQSNIKFLEQSRSLDSRSNKPSQTKQSSYADLDSYLRSKKDEDILASIEQSLSAAAKDFGAFVSQNISLDWNQRRDEVREAFGIVLTKQSAHTDENAMKKSKTVKNISWGKTFRLLDDDDNTSKLNVNSDHLIRGKFERYARLVNKLNDCRQGINSSNTTVAAATAASFDYAGEVSEFFKNGSDSKSKQFFESWKIISNFQSEKTSIDTFKHRVICRSRRHLELQFFEYIDNIYKTKVVEKGLPTILNKVKSYIEYQKLTSNGNLLIVNGLPIWAMIFYLLRCGCEKEALALVEEHVSVFKKVEQSFVSYFRAYVNSVDKSLPQDLITKIQNEFDNHVKKSVDGDPYRFSVYKILGRCQLARKNISNIALTTEDWLWMHLMLVKDDANVEFAPIHERYTLKDFQSTILSYGEEKFSNIYLQVLLLSGLFEEASKYAIKISEVDGIHLTIGLAYYQLLQHQGNAEELKKTSSRFAKLLGSYTRSFKLSDPRIAVEYLVLICLFSGEVETCHEALRELILETREFSILLGKVNAKGVRIPGKIEDRKSLVNLESDFLTKVTEQAAITADKEGRVFDGLLLYQLAEEYEIVITIINKMLGDYLSNSEFDEDLSSRSSANNETDPVLIAENFLNLYSLQLTSKNKMVTYRLLKISQIKLKYQLKSYDECLKLIEELEILPISFSTNLNEIRNKAEELTYLDENILKNIPGLLIVLMNCIASKKELLSQLNSSIRDEKLKELKVIAKNCIVFAGMVQYKMPRETFSLLISLEAKL